MLKLDEKQKENSGAKTYVFKFNRFIIYLMCASKMQKAEEAYLYVIEKSQGNPNFGKTLFWKILYFSDFDFYEHFQNSITNSKYRKIEKGPAPCNFDRIIKNLKNKGYIKEIKSTKKGKTQIKYISLRKKPNFRFLTLREKRQLEKNIHRLRGMNAKQVSEYSHQDMPYKATKMKNIIDYKLVFYRNPIFSVTNNND
jgi:ribosomal protein S8